MNIRAATVDDASALSELAVEAKGHWGYTQLQLRAWMPDLTLSPDAIERLPTFLAEADGEIAGCFQLVTSSSPWMLEHFWIRPRFMGRGIGRALLSHAVTLAADAGVTQLAIDSDPNAEAFYVACGAERVSVVPAPIEGHPNRVRPQLRLVIRHPDLNMRPAPIRGRG